MNLGKKKTYFLLFLKGYAPINFEDIVVLAALMRDGLPSDSTVTVKLSWMYFTASLQANLYPEMMLVG